MFERERYTEKTRRVIFFARYEASQFGSRYIETEHLLLGLLREDKALVNRFLGSHAAVDAIRRQIEIRTEVREKVSTSVDLPLSHACKRVLAYTVKERERCGNQHIEPVHLLAGILREEKSLAAELLRERGVQIPAVRAELHAVPPEAEKPTHVTPRRVTSLRFERFTEPAMRAALNAIREANELGSPAIEVEHLLLGVLREDRLEATRFLRSDAALESIRREIEQSRPANLEIPAGDDLALSRDYQRVLACATQDADGMGHQNVATGHLLLAILRHDKSLARTILLERGLTLSIIRNELTRG